MRRAARPATAGAEKLVPLTDDQSVGPKGDGSRMAVPGAARSGFLRPPGVGPPELLSAIASSIRAVVPSVFMLATLMTLWAKPGEPTVPGPLLPAEIVATLPNVSTTPSQNLVYASSSTETRAPKL
jgi:hypothetical protein